MTPSSALLRCRSCRSVNRVAAERLSSSPHCGKCKNLLEFPTKPVPVNTATFNSEVLEEPGFVLVFLWASWCAHCRGMFPSLEDTARQRAGIVKVVMINTEQEPSLARSFNAMSVPRLTLYKNGRIVDELNGAVQKSQLDAWLDQNLR
jgi:thioredoxin 2